MQPDNIQPTIPNPTVSPSVAPVATTAPTLVAPPITPTNPTQPLAQVVYAKFWDRFLAIFIDGLILSTISFVINFILGVVGALAGSTTSPDPIFVIVSMAVSTLIWIVQVAYPIYFIGSKGQTLGKMIMKIKVIKEDTGEIPGYTTAFLRETVGKFVSGIVFGIGYIVANKDPKKQSWHDKIAHTIVIKTNPQ